MHYTKSRGGKGGSQNDCDNNDYLAISEGETKSLQYIAGYVIHKLYKRFTLTNEKMNRYFQHCTSTLLKYKVDLDDTQILVTARDRGEFWKFNKFVRRI